MQATFFAKSSARTSAACSHLTVKRNRLSDSHVLSISIHIDFYIALMSRPLSESRSMNTESGSIARTAFRLFSPAVSCRSRRSDSAWARVATFSDVLVSRGFAFGNYY